jgi:hypothetical protein
MQNGFFSGRLYFATETEVGSQLCDHCPKWEVNRIHVPLTNAWFRHTTDCPLMNSVPSFNLSFPVALVCAAQIADHYSKQIKVEFLNPF